MTRRLLNESVWLKCFSIMVIVAPFVLLWGEMFTRALLPQTVDSKMNIYASDPVIGLKFEPYAKAYEKGKEYNALYQINSLGMRDREYGAKKEGIFRVLLLGDSFSVSHGLSIEDSLSRQMEKALQGVADSEGKAVKFEVINTAVGGYSPYNYWKAYRRWAPIFKPDVVLVGLSPDDYDCDNEDAHYLIENGETLAIYKEGQEPKSENFSIIKLRKWLSWNSEFYILMRNFFYYNDVVGRISLWVNARGKERISQLQQYVVPQPESMTKAWSKTFSYLQKLHTETAHDGATLIVMPIPLKLEIDEEVRGQALTASGLTPQQIDIDQPLKGISVFCKANHIPLLDPRHGIRKRHAEVPCYFVYDGHWNAEGVRFAAGSLANQWRNLGLPPWKNTFSGIQNHKANHQFKSYVRKFSTQR